MSLPQNILDYQENILGWGSVGPGWIMIIKELHDEMVKLDPEYTIEQIKEKFGGLRYYYTPSQGYGNEASDALENLVRGAEHLCSRTCETCGEPGSLRGDLSWLLTLCDKHYGGEVNRVSSYRTEPT